jgi:hypothetical protein
MLASDWQVGVQVLMKPPFALELAFTSGCRPGESVAVTGQRRRASTR